MRGKRHHALPPRHRPLATGRQAVTSKPASLPGAFNTLHIPLYKYHLKIFLQFRHKQRDYTIVHHTTRTAPRVPSLCTKTVAKSCLPCTDRLALARFQPPRLNPCGHNNWLHAIKCVGPTRRSSTWPSEVWVDSASVASLYTSVHNVILAMAPSSP